MIKESLTEALKLLENFSSNQIHINALQTAADIFIESLKNSGKLYSCGNGGSMCDAIHFAEELTGRFREERPALPAVAISDPGHISCVANDYGYQKIFSRYLEAWGSEGDVLLAISTSGNSPNIIEAVETAKKLNMKSVGLLGKDGGKLAKMVDAPIIVPSLTTERIQEIHIKCIHILIDKIERALF